MIEKVDVWETTPLIHYIYFGVEKGMVVTSTSKNADTKGEKNNGLSNFGSSLSFIKKFEKVRYFELCKCGHLKLVHAGVINHGFCMNTKCGCPKYTWIPKLLEIKEVRVHKRGRASKIEKIVDWKPDLMVVK